MQDAAVLIVAEGADEYSPTVIQFALEEETPCWRRCVVRLS